MYLFLDCSKFLTLGLLNRDFNWLAYQEEKSRKTTGHIHHKIFEMLKAENQTLKQVDGLFVASGPGSYTGIRISEGLAQVLEWQKIPVYSFNHFEVPPLLKENHWIFTSSAFKGEVFIDQGGKKGLLKKEAFPDFLRQHPDMRYFSTCKEEVIGLEGSFQFTSSLIKERPQRLFKEVLAQAKRSRPYYYRPLEKEFSVGKQV